MSYVIRFAWAVEFYDANARTKMRSLHAIRAHARAFAKRRKDAGLGSAIVRPLVPPRYLPADGPIERLEVLP